MPQVGRMETVPAAMPPDLGRMSPDSPWTVAYDDVVDSSVPISPNHVQVVRSLDASDEGSVYNVSPVTPGFPMRPSGVTGLRPVARLPLPHTLETFCDPVLGDPIAFAQCTPVSGSDSPLTLPVYPMPSSQA